ncbi:hypothetical protein SAMN05216227_102044 [Pseudorhodobacter antarcticus]|uniref:Uncharacterized protein n=2 Tax=Pseudorhodobacter antarcticus TaxID=1077947 RepID=A0A1H8IHD2_9RHOB|nr:hypothetical protein [Pseudorhodobacter antarcticus]SEN67934.1 hypothetical protein SAMN05216227_102044 [Pseudorhodobacter antarcticus]
MQSKSLGALLQGVSQQPAHIRPEGKLTYQLNTQSDVVRGLTPRPGLRELSELTGPAGLQFMRAEVAGEAFLLGHRAGVLKAWRLQTGAVVPVNFQDAAATAYVGEQLASNGYDGVLYVANRNVITATNPIPDTSSVITNQGTAYCLGGLFIRKYSVTITYADGAVAVGTYTTPLGTVDGDASKTTSTWIMQEIRTSLMAHGAFKAGTAVVRHEGLLKITATGAFTLSSFDDEDGTTMRSYTDRVENVADLAETASHGTLVRVTGNDAGGEDDYFLRFNSDSTDTLGAGWPSAGVWEEWYDPTEVTDFDLSTMPHVLRYTDGEFHFERGTWEGRRVGNEETVPMPPFIGHPIRDIASFQSRLVFAAAAAGIVCSRTKFPVDFFKKSATATLATDVIGMLPPSDTTVELDWIVMFDRDLVVMSDPGKGQFIVSGAAILTPSTASMVQTTAFEMDGGSRPVETGKTIVFPFQAGKYSGLNEFYTNDEVSTNGVETLTETADRYIIGAVNRIECSTNFNLLLCTTTHAPTSNKVWGYKYLWRGTDKVQSAFCEYDFPDPVAAFFFDGSIVYIIMWHALHNNYTLNAMDLDTPDDDVTMYPICLDRAKTMTVVEDTVVLPFPNASFVQSTGCVSIGAQADPTATTVGGFTTYTFNSGDAPPGSSVVAGIKFRRSIMPTMPFIRDRDGAVVARAHVVIGSFFIDYVDAGALDVTMKSIYREDTVFSVSFFEQADDPTVSAVGLRTGTLEVPWGERADYSSIEISSDDVRPATILEVKWAGQPFKP